MIDGVKIDVPSVTARYWLKCNLLDFKANTSVKTGKIDNTLIAKYKGLIFSITQSKKYKNRVYCSVRGSLHKYYNSGKTNANDFNFYQLQKVIQELKEKFHIQPENAYLRNLEFGVNVQTHITAQCLINNLVANGNRSFSDFKIQRKKVGKGIGKDEFQIKIYDKGKQENKPINNLVRFEYSATRMRPLKPFGIVKLSDLQHLDKLKPLVSLLLDFWNDSIYYDKQMRFKEMTNFEQKKLLYYSNARNWNDFERKQRLRAKAHFNKLMTKYGTSKDKEKTALLMAQKWDDLTAEKCPQIHKDKKKNDSRKMSTFSQLECTGKTWTNSINKKGSKKVQKSPTKKTNKKPALCITCKTDISHKKTGSLYCSKRCNNSYHAKQRKRQRHKIKNSEKRLLQKLTPTLHKSNLLLLIEYKDGQIWETVNLYQNEITSFWNWNRKVTKVIISDSGKTLTSHRAKTFINLISKLNFKTKRYDSKKRKSKKTGKS